MRAVKRGHAPPRLLEEGVEGNRRGGAALAIWLGILGGNFDRVFRTILPE